MIHRDIKPENILLMDDALKQPEKLAFHFGDLHAGLSDFGEGGVIKLCDFGWATLAPDEGRTTFCGTPDYLAPELLKSQPYGGKIDLWAVGILMYELLVGSAPFSGYNHEDTYSRIGQLKLDKSKENY